MTPQIYELQERALHIRTARELQALITDITLASSVCVDEDLTVLLERVESNIEREGEV